MTDPASPFQFQGDEDLRFLRDELYDGSWELMLDDLRARLEMRPQVYKITQNIKADIAAIERIMREEAASGAPDPAESGAPGVSGTSGASGASGAAGHSGGSSDRGQER